MDVPQMAEPLGTAGIVWQYRNRLRRIIKRRMNYVRNWLSEAKDGASTDSSPVVATEAGSLQAGDLVRVKSREEIQATLNRWNQLKGCSFMEEMAPYCGTTQRVLKRVDQFLDERNYQVRRPKGIVLLDGLFCEGTIDFGRCDRMCFFFWREEWLEKLNSDSA
jgi:hypothetical protein